MYSLFDCKGKKKVTINKENLSMFVIYCIFQEGNPIMVDIAGPLCFQGDYQVSCYNQTPWSELAPYNSIIVSKAKDVELPPPEDGDILAIHDTGAYTMSMYCK